MSTQGTTSPGAPEDGGDRAEAEAEQAARAAASRAGVRITHPTGVVAMHAVADLFADIWDARQGDPPIGPDVLRVLAHVGGYVATAERDGRVVGAGVGFFGPPAGATLHSHIVGVASGEQARGVGFAIKLDQRLWARRTGLDLVTWTYDPLVRRNGYVNLTKLGARAAAYLVDFYGPMRDGVNAGQGSDRLLVHWDVHAPLPGSARNRAGADPASSGAVVVLRGRADGTPQVLGLPAGSAPVLAAFVPEDIGRVRRADPGVARAWRSAVRETVGAAVQAGYVVTGMTRSGWYVLEASPPA